MRNSLSSTDIVFATLRQRGRIVDTVRLSGVTSLADVVTRLKGVVGGLTTIDLRNGTQGWSSRHTVMMSAL